MTTTEEERLQQMIREYLPNELSIDSTLWTRSAVQTLISNKCGVKMPIRTVGEYLKRWSMSPQKPLKRAYEQDPQRMKTWLDIEYPVIQPRTQQENAEIAWGDESGLRCDAQRRRSYAPIGYTPEIQPYTQQVNVNHIASVNNSRQGALHALHSKTDRTSVHH